ncbi:MAG: class I SAM-dependent methyltransferase [Spirochaetaceae bacterium]|nr:MAG: class I SAM-dependent methyltransferase [Spirochaetaceae bacterium]
MHGQSVSVGRYYDRAGSLFLRFGRGGESGSIHRPVWAPGVRHLRDAVTFVNRQLLMCMQEVQAADVLDLGCGVGGTIAYLRARQNARYTGITLSRAQADEANRRLRLTDRPDDADSKILQGDFAAMDSLEAPAGTYDFLYAVESMVHLASVDTFFASAARYGRSDSTLIVIDDFQKRFPFEGSVRYRRFQTYTWGWRVPSVVSFDELVLAAGRHGYSLEEFRDWTAYVSAHGIRDYLLRGFVPVLRLGSRYSEWCRSMVGGDALKRLLREEVVGYGFFRFSLTR